MLVQRGIGLRGARGWVVALSMLVAPIPVLAQSGESMPSPADAVRSTMMSLATHYQAGDLDAAGKLFADGGGVHIIEGAGVNHGWADYRDHHLAPELEAFENFRYSYSAVEPVVVGDMSYVTFRYELAADTESGHIESEGRGTAVLRKTADGWKIVHMHTSGRRR